MNWPAFLLAVAVIGAVPVLAFVSYPLLLRLCASRKVEMSRAVSLDGLRVAVVTVTRESDQRLVRKLEELIAFAATGQVSDIHVGLDGCERPDLTGLSSDVSCLQFTEVQPAVGKNAVLRQIHSRIDSDVIVFTDVDASVSVDSLTALIEEFRDPTTGAVTGQRQIRDDSEFAQAQQAYADLDQRIRSGEMDALGSVTSCDGKLYAIRRDCLSPVPDGVTDDLHTGLGAIAAGKRLVFAPEAIAMIPRPARDHRHELSRRRRVTNRGLNSLWHRRALLNPFRHGRYGIALLINKGCRRLLGPGLLVSGLCVVFAVLMNGSSVLWGARSEAVVVEQSPVWNPVWSHAFVWLPGVVVILGMAWLLVRKSGRAYLVLGLGGMTLGAADFLLGRRVTLWTPHKGDADDVERLSSSLDTRRDLRLHYWVSHYPKPTETFIVDEVRALQRDFELTIHPIVARRPVGSAAAVDTLEDRVDRQPLCSVRILVQALREARRSWSTLCSLLGVLARETRRVPRVGLKTLAQLPQSLARAHQLRQHPPDFLHAGFASYAATQVWLVARLLDRPFGFSAHANDIFKSDFLLAQKVNDADAVVCISDYNVQLLARFLREGSDTCLAHIPTGVNCEAQPYQDPPAEIETLEIVSVGSLLEKKGHQHLIEAVRRMADDGVDVRCRIIGEGLERPGLTRQIVSAGMSDRIKLMGVQSRVQVRDALHVANLFVLACSDARDGSADGIPVALMEAMAAGVPVVSTRLRAIPELVIDDRTGVLVDPPTQDGHAASPCVATADALAMVLRKLAGDHERRVRLARAARTHVEQYYDQAQLTDQRRQLFSTIVQAQETNLELNSTPRSATAADRV